MGNIPTKAQIIIVTILGVFIFFGGIRYHDVRLSDIEMEVVGVTDNLPAEGQQAETEGNAVKEIAVHVAGAVQKPGVYFFPEGARVEDAVQAAIPLKEADLNQLNLAVLLQDSKRLDVPFKEEKTKSVSAKQAGSSKDEQIPPENKFGYVTPADKLGSPVQEETTGGKININTASKDQLIILPRIGPAIADRIIEYRQKEGPFKRIEDLDNVSGIGEATMKQLKDLITVE
jgi:competence protein ComEA